MKSWLKRAAGIIFTDGKSILLLQRSDSGKHPETWALPGGKAKEGESDIATAIREVKEETGIESIPGHRFDEMANKENNKKFTAYFYWTDKQFDVSLSNEHLDWAWVSFDQMKEYSLHPKLKEHLPEYLRKIRRKTSNFSEWTNITEAMISL